MAETWRVVLASGEVARGYAVRVQIEGRTVIFRESEAAALRDLVAAAYRSRGRELPEPAPQAALPGVR